jgi:hypothetical protein
MAGAQDDTLGKALVRAHRWRRKIESAHAKSITDLAEQEGVTDTYICLLLPLTRLAPDIVEAVLDGRQPEGPEAGRGAGEWAARLGRAASELALRIAAILFSFVTGGHADAGSLRHARSYGKGRMRDQLGPSSRR